MSAVGSGSGPGSSPMPPRFAGAGASLRHVFVRDLEVMTVIGVHEYEKRAAQRVIVNLDLAVAEQGPTLTDRLGDVLDYAEVVRGVERILRAGHVNLLETLAERVAEHCLADPRVRTVRVRMEKPDVIPNARSVGIEIERLQSQTAGAAGKS